MIKVGHNGPSQDVYVIADERGASDEYEAYSLYCVDTRNGRTLWTEGIRKDRSTMIEAYRAPVEEALLQLKAKAL